MTELEVVPEDVGESEHTRSQVGTIKLEQLLLLWSLVSIIICHSSQ